MLEVKNIYKQYQAQPLLEGISLQVEKQEIICVLGPSGSGKSTLLRIIAGLEPPDSGRVYWGGEDITERPAHLRKFGLMFQDYALFPHMNVRENVAFGLLMQNLEAEKVEQRVREVLEMVHMEDFENRRVTDLSGGEQQRVALARTLAPQPSLLMLDEPLGALDRTLRAQLSSELRALLRRIQIPVIYVTHDQDEAFSIGNRVIILYQGHIVQSGTPNEVYVNPRSLWLASFLGMDNHLPGKVVSLQPLKVATVLGMLICVCPHDNLEIGQTVTLVLRPTGVELAVDQNIQNVLNGKVVDTVYNADRYKSTIQFGGQYEFAFFLNSALETGQSVRLTVRPEAILCYKNPS